jgi:hypothetical protein
VEAERSRPIGNVPPITAPMSAKTVIEEAGAASSPVGLGVRAFPCAAQKLLAHEGGTVGINEDLWHRDTATHRTAIS